MLGLHSMAGAAVADYLDLAPTIGGGEPEPEPDPVVGLPPSRRRRRIGLLPVVLLLLLGCL